MEPRIGSEDVRRLQHLSESYAHRNILCVRNSAFTHGRQLHERQRQKLRRWHL